MIEPFVLKNLKAQLAASNLFGTINESNPVIRDIFRTYRDDKDKYLSMEREIFFGTIHEEPESAITFQVEALLEMFGPYWDDAVERYKNANDGIGEDGVRWSVIKIYYAEVLYYIAYAYYLLLLHPSDEFYDLQTHFKGIRKRDVHHAITKMGLLTERRIVQLEENMEITSGEKIEPGKIMKMPWSGEPLVDDLSRHPNDRFLLNPRLRMERGLEFRALCRTKAQDKNLSQEDKEIWARAILNTLNEQFKMADGEKNMALYEMTSMLCAALEEEFMQMASPICVKKIGMGIGALEIFNDVIVIPNETENESSRVVSFNRFLLEDDLGANCEFYEKIMCKACPKMDCPYDIYWRKYQEDGLGIPGKFNFASQEKESSKQDDFSKKESSIETILSAHPELQQLIDAGLIDSNFQLTADSSRRKIVEYCIDHDLFSPRHIAEWRRIDNILIDQSGKSISAGSLKQATQDYEQRKV